MNKNEVILSDVKNFGELANGDKFVFEYELKWKKHSRGGFDSHWVEEDFVTSKRLPYKISNQHLPLLGIYQKGEGCTYKLIDIVEDYRKNGNFKLPQHRGASYENNQVRKVL